MDFAPFATLIGAAAAFVGALAFLLRAATPAIVAWMSEDTQSRASVRRELADLRAERDALERRNAILEMRAHLRHEETDP